MDHSFLVHHSHDQLRERLLEEHMRTNPGGTRAERWWGGIAFVAVAALALLFAAM